MADLERSAGLTEHHVSMILILNHWVTFAGSFNIAGSVSHIQSRNLKSKGISNVSYKILPGLNKPMPLKCLELVVRYRA